MAGRVTLLEAGHNKISSVSTVHVTILAKLEVLTIHSNDISHVSSNTLGVSNYYFISLWHTTSSLSPVAGALTDLQLNTNQIT